MFPTNMKDPCIANEYSTESDDRLLHLARVAMRALEAENAALAAAYAQGNYRFPEYYRDANQGLAYWVAETNLIYEIYKAWIPLIRVRWEAPAYPGSNQRADLAVYDDDGGESPLWVFEAKWWGRSTARILDALLSDLEKLAMCHQSAQRRFLMTFWWAENTDDARRRSTEDIKDFCRKNPVATLRFMGGFPTDCSRGRVTRVEEFTMALLEVAVTVIP